MEVYFLMKLLLGNFTKLVWIGKVEGKHNVPRSGPVIIAPNHQSMLDFCFLATVLNRRLYFLVASKFYKNPIARLALNRMNHIRVDLKQGDRSYLYDAAKNILDRGHTLVVFPEGWMTFDGKIQKAYLGVARMALASKVPIIPTVIESYHIYPRHNKWPKFFNARCKIKFLEPIPYDKLKNKTPEHIVHDLLMPEIARELGHKYPKPEFKPEAKSVV
jgi:1-acyl-sn-glycerol-3-phosphate acyltransferase